jgi:hypothetical protein
MESFTLVIWLAIADPGDGYRENRFDGFSKDECWAAAQLAKEKLMKPWQGSAFYPNCVDTQPDPFVIIPHPYNRR